MLSSGSNFVALLLLNLEQLIKRIYVWDNTVDNDSTRAPILIKHYSRFLEDQNSAVFIKTVAQKYMVSSLERVVRIGDRIARRAGVLALGYLGEYESNHIVGCALIDEDRGVRTIAENAIRNLWCRVGSIEQRKKLRENSRLLQTKQFEEAIQKSTKLIHESPWIAESWCQRGTAYFHTGEYELSTNDCHQALEINPYHFTAAAGMGQCYLLRNNPVSALESFRRALRLNPNMEEVRAQVIRLQKAINNEER